MNAQLSAAVATLPVHFQSSCVQGLRWGEEVACRDIGVCSRSVGAGPSEGLHSTSLAAGGRRPRIQMLWSIHKPYAGRLLSEILRLLSAKRPEQLAGVPVSQHCPE